MSVKKNKSYKSLGKSLIFGYALLSVCLLYFAYGFAVAYWYVFPYEFLNKVCQAVESYMESKDTPIPLAYLVPARYEEEGVVVGKPGRMSPGATLITGAWKNSDPSGLGVRIIDPSGDVLHEWVIKPEHVWDKSPHSDRVAGSKDESHETYIHGTWLLSNGDIVLNLEYYGLVCLNSDSEVVWKLPYRTHHSVFRSQEGDFWVCGQKWIEKQEDKYLGLILPVSVDTILEVSRDGKILREISLFDSLYRSGYEGLMFDKRIAATGDIIHLNDVEVLGKEKAGKFELFESGDIMVSLRNANTILVLDGKTELIKWSLMNTQVGQHDPDFTDDGRIVLFDNYVSESKDVRKVGGSRILSIDPSTKDIQVLYGDEPSEYFFTRICGKQQILPNGNLLITESLGGRVFEVDSNGEVVWSWIVERWDDEMIPEVLEGTRYTYEYMKFLGMK